MSGKKLFIPGPTHVRPEILQACGTYPVGHRSSEFRRLHQEVVDGVRWLLATSSWVILSTSSATGLMEAAVRNLCRKKVLNLVCGAFSQRQADITAACGLPQTTLEVPWGRANQPEEVEQALAQDEYDVVTVVYNETSTGLTNPLQEIAAVVRKFPEVLLVVDAVSAMAGLPLEMDAWGVDVVFASVQKAWALPPGFAILALNERALRRAEQVPQSQRGYYFDFPRLVRAADKNQTLVTPSLPHIFALRVQLQQMRAEGKTERFARHREMADFVRNWGVKRFGLFPDPAYASDTLTCFANKMDLDYGALVTSADRRGFQVSGGYGPLKGRTFRLAHMGDLTLEDMQEVTAVLDEIIEELSHESAHH